MNGIGIWIGKRRGASTNSPSYWANSDLFLFFGEVSKISGGRLNNQVTGASDYLTVGGSAGSETYQAPDTAPYKTADTDYIWFKTDSSQRTTTTAELIGYDFPRTLVKYDNSTPYQIREIVILKAGESLTAAESNLCRDYMQLSIWWDNTLSSHGNLKGNRGVGQSVWVPEVLIPNDSWLWRWDFNGDALDTSGKGNNVTTNLATLTTDRNSVADKAYTFAAGVMARNYVAVTNGIFTMTFWFKANAWTNFNLLVGNAGLASYNSGYAVTWHTGNLLRFWLKAWDGSGGGGKIDKSMSDTTSWHFVCIMYDKVNTTMYFSVDDGALTTASVNYDAIFNYGYVIGLGYPGTLKFNGSLDQIYYYNRILTPTEITQLFNYYK